jgi:hypothetical protein
MSDYLSEIYEILSQPKTASTRFREHFRHVLTKLTAEHSEIFSPKTTEDFVEFLEKNKWNVIRQWIAQADRIELESYLNSRAKTFFRERRKALKTAAIGNTPWASVIERAAGLPDNDRILATYCLVDGLSGNALKRAVRSDIRLRIETTGAISTSRSNLLNKLLAYCHPDDSEMIIAVKNVRQRSGRRRIS